MASASTSPLTDFWTALPEELRAKLRLGFTGKQHLLDIAGWCLRSGNSNLAPIAADALQTALGENPFNGEMATELLAHDAIRAILSEPTLTTLQAVAEHWRKPDNTGYFERLLGQRDFAKLKHFIEQSILKEPDNLFWREQAVAFGLIDNDPDWVEARMDDLDLSGLDAAMGAVQAQICSVRNDHAGAARHFQATKDAFGHSFASLRAGLCLLREDDPASANLLLSQCLGRAPWNIHLLLRIHDLLAGRDTGRCPLDGSVAILLYSWNKAVELDATLRSLFESELDNASVYVLDNGSTDATGDMLASWQTRFDNRLGKERFTVVTLPVNIGAPPARNWLMHHPPVGEHDYVCYLDDDVELPPDWLARFGAAVAAYPDAGVWGCKVVDHANPALIQSADSHLLVDPDAPSVDFSNTAPNPFKLSNLHVQGLDFGQFDMMRPCASVTGCCHLFRTATLMESGDFAIHLSPSQYDDMEHDLRLCRSGQFPVYQGHLAIRHKKRTGAASRTSMQEEGNALGNKYKMQTMHDHADLLAAMQAEQAMLEEDILHKITVVEQALLD